jgi:signal transduction histidine kinase
VKHPGLALAAAGAAFTAGYYGAHRVGTPPWGTDALLVVPALLATVFLWRRGGVHGAARWHWRLLAMGTGLWTMGAALWAGLELAGQAAGGGGGWRLQLPIPLEAFVASFLAPMLAALTLGHKPPRLRRDPLGAADAALASAFIAFLFVRVILLPRLGSLRASVPVLLLGAEALALSCWAFSRARRTRHSSQRWPYVCVGSFALSYGILSSLAHGWAGDRSLPGGPMDAAWILPFFLLAAATLPQRGLVPRPLPPAALLLLAGPAPLLADWILDAFLAPASAAAHQGHLLLILPLSALLAVGTALRLALGEQAGRQAAAAWQAKVEEAQRAARLSALASMSSAMLARLRRSVAEVARCAEAAAPSFPRRATQVMDHARGAETIVSTMEAALLPLQSETRSIVDLGQLLEESVRVALESEAPLEVHLEGLTALDPVVGDPVALRTAFLQLVANAAEASPDGVLHIRAEREGEDLVLRFIDDGPGVAPAIQGRIFDPFFTTGPPGEAVGLGLTLVHAVARSHRGSIVLEPSAEGATFALRLPALRPHPGALPHWGAVASATAAAVAGAGLFDALSGDPRALILVGSISVVVWGVYGLTSRRRSQPASPTVLESGDDPRGGG